MLHSVSNILSDFKRLNFSEVPDAILLNRVEKKFLLNRTDFFAVIKALNPSYLCLEINNCVVNNYYNTYFDTPDFDFFSQHHNKKMQRLKVRKRYYQTTNTYFLEIKQKSNERTTKNRLEIFNADTFLSDNEKKFLSTHISNTNFSPFTANVHINYKRLSMINTEKTERLSFDFDIDFVSENHSLRLNNLIVAECKQIKNSESYFINLLKQNNIKRTSFSKYCVAVSKFYPNVKHNNFKKQLTFLEEYFYDNALDAVTN